MAPLPVPVLGSVLVGDPLGVPVGDGELVSGGVVGEVEGVGVAGGVVGDGVGVAGEVLEGAGVGDPVVEPLGVEVAQSSLSISAGE